MNISRYISVLILSCVFASGCSVQKRVYRPGYYVSWNHRISSPDNASASVTGDSSLTRNHAALIKDEATSAFTQNKIYPPKKEKENDKLRVIGPDSCGDVITMKDGSIVTAKVVSVGPDEIKYKRCDNLSGPSYSVNKSEIASIRYANGVNETFGQKVQTPKPSSNEIHNHYADRDNDMATTNAKISKTFGILSVVFAVLCFACIGLSIFALMSIESYLAIFPLILSFIFLVLALVFGIVAIVGSLIAKKKNTSNDEKLNKQAKIGLILGAIGVGLIVLAILTFIGMGTGLFY
jgi:hypothetical protein